MRVEIRHDVEVTVEDVAELNLSIDGENAIALSAKAAVEIEPEDDDDDVYFEGSPYRVVG